MKKKYIKAEDFDKAFDEGHDVSEFLDFSNAERPAQQQKRVNVDFPAWMIHALDKEARKLGVTRQSVIKFWIAEKLTRGAA
jgi:hypothetical protein